MTRGRLLVRRRIVTPKRKECTNLRTKPIVTMSDNSVSCLKLAGNSMFLLNGAASISLIHIGFDKFYPYIITFSFGAIFSIGLLSVLSYALSPIDNIEKYGIELEQKRIYEKSSKRLRLAIFILTHLPVLIFFFAILMHSF